MRADQVTSRNASTRAARSAADGVGETLREVRRSLSENWHLFRRVAKRSQDPNFAYDFAVLYLKVYFRYRVIQVMVALGFTADSMVKIDQMSGALRALRVKALHKLIVSEPDTVLLVSVHATE